jgi:hypothetical protein
MIRAGVDMCTNGREAFSKKVIHWYPSKASSQEVVDLVDVYSDDRGHAGAALHQSYSCL